MSHKAAEGSFPPHARSPLYPVPTYAAWIATILFCSLALPPGAARSPSPALPAAGAWGSSFCSSICPFSSDVSAISIGLKQLECQTPSSGFPGEEV
jgi:hypothetical protein